MQGTPYIYQGEEFGMTNPNFETIDDYRDVESLNTYRIMTERGVSKEEVLDILKQKSRDNARTPMQWNSSAHAGFTDGTPWIDVARNYEDINAENALKDQDSIFYYYQRLIQLRKSEPIITDGKYRLILASDSDIFAYVRETDNEQLVVLNNFYDKEVTYDLTNEGIFAKVADVLISNMDDQQGSAEKGVLRPYESVVYYIK